MRKTEVAIIGAGPGGYVAAIRAHQLGLQVTLIEREAVGGVCLNVGCIPSKALLTLASHRRAIEKFQGSGIQAAEVTVDAKAIFKQVGKTVKQLTGGVKQLLKANGVDLIQATARFKDAHTLVLAHEEGEEELRFEHAIIATGSKPQSVAAWPFSERIVDFTTLLGQKTIPERLAVVGVDTYGLELAQAYAGLGSDVSVVLLDPKAPLAHLSAPVAKALEKELKKSGLKFVRPDGDLKLEEQAASVVTSFTRKGETRLIESDQVLLSVGREVATQALNLEAAGVYAEAAGDIPVDEQGRTSQPHIYAIGDVTGAPFLAHRASYEAKVVAAVIAGQDVRIDYLAMPQVVFTEPEVATAGFSEAEAQAAGLEVQAKRFPYAANGRALTYQATAGYVNLIAQADTGRLVGAEIVGLGASNMINELTLAMESGHTIEDLALTVHPHPTLGESIMEASEAWLGLPIHTK